MRLNKHITSFTLGLNSGCIYALLVSSLIGYLFDSNISLAVTGLFTLVMLPYACKPLWSPIVDSFRIGLFPEGFGQRKEWIIVPQCILLIGLVFLGKIDLNSNFGMFFLLASIISFMGATSDIALHGYRIELFEKDFMSNGSAFNALGFRIGLFIAGSCGLYFASISTWNTVFIATSVMLIPGLVLIALSEDNREPPKRDLGFGVISWIKYNYIKSTAALFKRDKIIYVLLLLGFYKVSDGYLETMFIPFVEQIGFSHIDAANARAVGIFTGVIGNFVGVKILHRIGMGFGLLSAEILSVVTNLLFIILIDLSKNATLLFAINGVESFFTGVSNIALLYYISSICVHKRFTASHFAILYSFSMILKTLLSGTSGWLATEVGWAHFFAISSVLSVPSLLCIWFLFFRKYKS